MTGSLLNPPRVCAQTGLQLVRASGEHVYRIATTKHGPLDPKQRGTGPLENWSRWDVVQHRTAYAADTAFGAYCEVLAYVTPGLPDVPLASVFTDESIFEKRSLAQAVDDEFPRLGMAVGTVSQKWRDDRRLYELALPSEGWFIDVTAAVSVAALRDLCFDELAILGIDTLTVSELTAPLHRGISRALAARLHRVVLDDGTLPHGLTYTSKWGTDLTNYAVWLRRTDDGYPHAEPTHQISEQVIDRHADHDFRKAARFHKLLAY